jgi:chemotaxis family two-component system sensor kinase Cph1
VNTDPRTFRFLGQCENEALHLSGAIQPHGSLFVADEAGKVTHVSANIHDFLGLSPECWIGQSLPDDVLDLIDLLPDKPGSRNSGVLVSRAAAFDVVVTRSESGSIVVELTGQVDDATIGVLPLVLIPEPVPGDIAGMQAIETALVEQIADLTGFQRVMYYRFREDGDGEVIAEARRGDAYGSYLGLRYPASDIPQIARALYLKNPWRMIPDATAEPVPILGQVAPPDLTYSDLRSVSPVHQAYLANMGVGASLSFPVTRRGELIALIAAHHREKRPLSPSLLAHAAALVRNHALTCSRYQAQVSMQAVDGMAHRFSSLKPLLRESGGYQKYWPQLAQWLLDEFAADGVHLCVGTIHLQAGKSGKEGAIDHLCAWFKDQQEIVSHRDSLERLAGVGAGEDIAGVLTLRSRLRNHNELRLYLTRQEHIYEVAWGGNPQKPIELGHGGLDISPRRSFERWMEKRTGYCRAWTSSERLLALRLRDFLMQEITL